MSETSNIHSTSPVSNDCEPISLWKPEDGLTGTIVFQVMSPDQFDERIRQALESGGDPTQYFSFPTYESMHRRLTPTRMAILRAMMGSGPLGIREIARRMGRDFKGVHTDVTAMFTAGLLWKDASGKLVFPFDTMRFDVELTAAQFPSAAE